MLKAGFELTIPASEWPQTHTLDRAGKTEILAEKLIKVPHFPHHNSPRGLVWDWTPAAVFTRQRQPAWAMASPSKGWLQFPQGSTKRQSFVNTAPYRRRGLWPSECCDMRPRATRYIWYGSRMTVTRHSKPTAGQGRCWRTIVLVSYFAAPGTEKFGAAGVCQLHITCNFNRGSHVDVTRLKRCHPREEGNYCVRLHASNIFDKQCQSVPCGYCRRQDIGRTACSLLLVAASS